MPRFTLRSHLVAALATMGALVACSASPSGTCASNGDCLGTEVCDPNTSTCVQTSSGTGAAAAGSTTGASTSAPRTTSSSTGGHGSTGGTTAGGSSGGSGIVVDGLLVGPLVLSSSAVSAGETLTGTATLTNQGSVSVTLEAVDIAARPPGGTNTGGPFDDLYDGPGTTLAPGQSFKLSGGRAITAQDPTGSWYAYVTFEDSSGTYHDCPVDVTFTVGGVGGSTSSGGTTTHAGGTTGGGGSSTSAGSTTGGSASTGNSSGGGTTGGLSVRVQGNHLVDAQGHNLQLRGVNVSGLEFVAVQGWDPSDPWGGGAPTWSAITSWQANAVRLPLNEASWEERSCTDESTNATKSADPGHNYVATVTSAVNQATAAGLYVILDLHMTAPGDYCPYIQIAMADADNSVAFWTSIATAFKGYPNVVFELFNEPFVTQANNYNGNGSEAQGWQYLMQGTGISGDAFGGFGDGYNAWVDVMYAWQGASMQSMITSIRNAGATNVVLVGGLYYNQALDDWLTYVPTDPAQQMGASWHPYPTTGSGICTSDTSEPCFYPQVFDQAAGILDAGYPIVMTELGEGCSPGTVGAPETTNVTCWADQNDVSALGWGWNPLFYGSGAGCEDVLVTNASGTPTDGYGQVFQAWLESSTHP